MDIKEIKEKRIALEGDIAIAIAPLIERFRKQTGVSMCLAKSLSRRLVLPSAANANRLADTPRNENIMSSTNSKFVAVNGHVENRAGQVIEFDVTGHYGVEQGFIGYGDTPEQACNDADNASDWQSHVLGACGVNNPLCPFCKANNTASSGR
jgi:hypothetical protein